MKDSVPKKVSAFSEFGLSKYLEWLEEEIRTLYSLDDTPWIIGYSGGKDSTATLQLIWNAVSKLPDSKKTKVIHVISTDTLVENPIVAAWVTRSLLSMETAAKKQSAPFQPHRLTPKVEDSFWVNLIGKGYPVPRHKFRWCTERLKIKPSTSFINGIVKSSGEAILVLGTRKAESIRRAITMKEHEVGRVRDRLSPNAGLPGSLVYTPVEDWTNDDVWMFLMQTPNPWGYNNKDLLGMYAGASADGECPLVVDSSTPSCGDSRFGCWVCTLVEKDKSMTAMIQNDAEKEWMLPLLKLRNKLDFRLMGAEGDEESTDRHLRDFRRMNGTIQLMQSGRTIPGSYLKSAREDWLRELLRAQVWIRKNGPRDVADIELIAYSELQEIRRIWVIEKHELEDTLPGIYQEITGSSYPCKRLDDTMAVHAGDLALLEAECLGDPLHYELARELLSVTRQSQRDQRRAGHFEKMEKAFARHYFEDSADAISSAKEKAARRSSLVPGEAEPNS